MSNAKPSVPSKNPEAPGPFTPLTTPEDVGNASGGEWQVSHSSATPQTPEGGTSK